MKKLAKLTALSLSSVISFAAFNSAYATSYQIFADLNFANPASLNTVKNGELIIGNATLFSRTHFSGSALGVNGSTTSYNNDALPYGRIAMRVSPKFVIGFDITEPYYTNITYPNNNFANAFATATVLRDVNYSPKISYQATERLALGAGLDFNNLYNGQLSFALIPAGHGAAAGVPLINKADSWATGWDVGLSYVLTPATFLNFAYYSLIVQHAKGESDFGAAVNNGFSADVKLPATWIVNGIQMLSPVWALSGTIRYTQWNTVRFTVLQNTVVGNVTVPDHFYNNASYELATHYQINQKWGALAAIDYEPNVQPTYTRNIGLPTYNRYIPAIGADYELTKGLKAKLIYAHVFVKAPINLTAAGAHLLGTERINVDVLDFSLNYDF
jgi:long-chain fatty acid transport protein